MIINTNPKRKKQCCRFLKTSSQYVTMGNVLASNFERTSTVSICFWFKCTVDGTFPKREIISKTDPDSSFIGFDIACITNGRLTVRWDNTLITNGRFKEWSGDMTDNVWRQAIYTQSNGGNLADMKLYVNGVENTTVTSSAAAGTSTTVTTAPLIIGGDLTGRYFNGKIDNVAIYNKELTSGEVTTLYGGGTIVDHATVGPTANLIGYWRMGEGASFPTIPDASSGGNNGTMTNMLRIDITNR
jgi:hypothetical protein